MSLLGGLVKEEERNGERGFWERVLLDGFLGASVISTCLWFYLSFDF